MNTKICFKCKQEKQREEFYKHSEMGDGLLGKCKQCTKEDVRKHRAENIEKIRAYDRARSKMQHRKTERARRSKLHKKLFPFRTKARSLVGNAIRDKRLIRPTLCEICCKKRDLEGHHDDYKKPLTVVWMCKPCHRKYHVGVGIIADNIRVSVEEKIEERRNG